MKEEYLGCLEIKLKAFHAYLKACFEGNKLNGL